MSLRETELEIAVQELVEEGRRKLGATPTADELLAYHRDELAPEEAVRIQEFLAHYPESARELIDLVSRHAPPFKSSPEDLTEDEMNEDWQALQLRLGPVPRRSRIVPVYAMAASVLMVFLAAWSFTLLQRNEELGRPLINPRHREMLPDGTRGPGEAPPITLDGEWSHLLLTLAIVDRRTFPDYRLEIVESDESGGVLWSANGLHRNEDDTFELWIPRGFLPSGRYSLKLYGVGSAATQLLATYTVEL